VIQTVAPSVPLHPSHENEDQIPIAAQQAQPPEIAIWARDPIEQENYRIAYRENETVESLKNRYFSGSHTVELTFQGRLMENDRLVSDYEVPSDAEILVRPIGGTMLWRTVDSLV
jgi:hypothetical protein